MTKQEKIREGLERTIVDERLILGYSGKLASKILSYLHSQGVVIEVERELPEYPYPLVTQIAGEMEIIDTWHKIYNEAQSDMLKAGYVAVVPIKEEK